MKLNYPSTQAYNELAIAFVLPTKFRFCEEFQMKIGKRGTQL